MTLLHSLAVWALVSLALAGFYTALHWAVELLRPNHPTPTSAPTCRCGQEELGDGVIAIRTRGTRHSTEECQ